jgi:ribosomal-protein-alanine N-acetyltransferase
LILRPATPADLPAILALERACADAAHWSEPHYLEMLHAPHRNLLLVAEDAGALLGFVALFTASPEWELGNVAVAAAARRRGIGRGLISAAQDVARRRHAEAIHLEVRESNAAARALYGGAGFAESGRRRAYYHDPAEDAVLYKWCNPAARNSD